jgi:ABC-type oligopeptide transport system substrate-binding subunit
LRRFRQQLAYERRGKIVKFVKVIAIVAFAAASLSLGACASKKSTTTTSASVGYSK